MSIICPTHFTDSSSSALDVATALARKRHESLYLINVQPGGSHNGEQAAALQALHAKAVDLRAQGLSVGTEVRHGPLGPEVARFCAEQTDPLLVVGDPGHPRNVLLESNLDQLAYRAGVPMLLVRDARRLLAWLKQEAPLKLFLSLDRTQASAKARDWITRLAKYGPLEVVVCHLWWPTTEYLRRGLNPSLNGEGHAALETLLHGELTRALRGLPKNVTWRLHLEIGHKHLGDQLLAVSMAERADVFVMGTHPHLERGPIGRLWSVSREVLSLAPMSVACVPGSTNSAKNASSTHLTS